MPAPDRHRSRFFRKALGTTRQFIGRMILRWRHAVDGPALLIEPHQTIVVEPGWRAEMIAGARAGADARGARGRRAQTDAHVDPVLLEVFANLFMAIAEEMGATLQNTATSVNIKERLDFSCAMFDARGRLVANAPHMPVHLGSMGDCVTAIMRKHPRRCATGDVFVTNAPYDGGTHLPDVTVVMPVFVDGVRAFFVASRGHHADIGGITPGSMPPFSTRHRGRRRAVRRHPHGAARSISTRRRCARCLASGAWPARNPDQNIADLKAQAASCAKGAQELARMPARSMAREVVERLYAPCAGQCGRSRCAA